MTRLGQAKRAGRSLCISLALTLAFSTVAVNSQSTACSFTGAATEQAKCLLRPVRIFGELGPTLASLPAPLDRLVGEPTAPTVTRDALTSYLTAHGIRAADIGGSLSAPIVRSASGESARYFIIHDTSAPLLERTQSFPPANMDTADWPGNRLRGHVASRRAHVFINRMGVSATAVDFGTAKNTTKFESRALGRRGLFVGIELIQPRRKDRRGIDSESPNPGFSDAQLDRLALVYVAASVRRGQWLIPAYHAAVDAGLRDAHDDPQHFDLNSWAARLNTLLADIGGGVDNRSDSSPTVAPQNADPSTRDATEDERCAASLPLDGATPIPRRFIGGQQLLRLRGNQLFIKADMDIDADGSPRAPVIDPCRGCGQLATSLTYPGITGQARFVNSEEVPYFVLPGGVFKGMGIGLGDVGAVIFHGKVEYALFADSGPRTKIGEGSIKLAQLFGHNPFITRRDGSRIIGRSIPRDVIYIVFPGSKNSGINPSNVVEKTRTKGRELFLNLCRGGGGR